MISPRIIRTLCAIAVAAVGFTPQAIAQTVELIGNDGSFRVSGKLISAANKKFTVETNIGIVSFDKDEVICKGAACPVAIDGKTDVTIAAPGQMADVILPLLAEGFAARQEMNVRLLSTSGMSLDADNTSQGEAATKRPFDIQFNDYSGDAVSRIAVEPAGGNEAFAMLANGAASIILSETPVDDATARTVRASGGGNLRAFDQERVVAVDGYVVVTHPDNPVATMSVDQIAAVMAGQISNWSVLGGPDLPITVYGFGRGTDVAAHVEALLMQPLGLALSDTSKTVQSNRELTVSVENDPTAIGVVSYSSVRDTHPIAIKNECGMVIEPSEFNIRAEEYTLQNRITAYSLQTPDGLTGEFVNYLDAPELDDLVSKAGLISLSVTEETSGQGRDRVLAAVEAATSELSSDKLRNFVVDAMRSSRLSTTFRFAPASSELDNKALRDLGRVVRYAARTKPKRLILAGFADSNGGFNKNLALSASRAQAVRAQLARQAGGHELDGVEIVVSGFGELGPIACNSSYSGRAKNRRVEVWVE
ncbi:MAG: phosphate ABC transporter substrate-binding/OmpA family protein [Albidovulum sp.]